MKHDIAKLPLWARVHIATLEQRIERVEQTLPWHEPGMEWFTIIHPRFRQAGDMTHRKLFTCDEGGTHCVCSIGPLDTVFVGLGKADRLREDSR